MTDKENQSPNKKKYQKQTALHCGVGLLARREHSEFELRQKLASREFPAQEIESAIERLLEKGYLSDDRFAQSMCRYRVNRGYGWRYIANELKQKGVCSTIIQHLQKNCEIDWYLQAELAYNKRFGESRRENLPISKKEQAKKIRFLQYRGFSTDEIFAVVNDN
ncbi:recombination regulator RecX [Colwellia sp. MSW7]|jgi:regulatory protein|uniref:Regulatory protein RecX n=1 Tax=Colwellia maritima TaxID=2912588 RepID=A0ABS9X390_9GAMM|nr:regulatory protein RecX [Colwellia maritima]MCI2284691.1 recombination regulator RecX [Colwellia maritima]